MDFEKEFFLAQAGDFFAQHSKQMSWYMELPEIDFIATKEDKEPRVIKARTRQEAAHKMSINRSFIGWMLA